MVTRRTHAGFLSDNEAARERRRTQDYVKSITGCKQPTRTVESNQSTGTNEANDTVVDHKFWASSKGQVVQAIVLNRAYTRNAILEVTKLKEEYFEQTLKELAQAKLLEEKDGDKFWVTRELYWQCQRFYQELQKNQETQLLPVDHSKSSQRNTLDNHVTKKEFLEEFFGLFGRDLGNPGRWFTDNPSDLLPFIEECAKNKLPAFMSVQPEKDNSHLLGIEKIFFDFDYCKNSEILAEAEIQKRKNELRDEVKYFLKQLGLLNIKPLVVRTRKGYHVHVFFDSVYEINQKLNFWKKVYKQLQVGLMQDHSYRFIDYAVVGDINRMCRIPLSIHEKSGEECVIVDNQLEPDKIRSIEYFKLYGLKQKDVLSAMDKTLEFEKTLKQKQISYATRSLAPESVNGIRPCFTKAMDSGEMCHQQRLALLSEAYSIGFHSPESIIDIFRCFNDFDESITEYQVNWFFSNWVEKGEIRPYNCRTIQKYGWCLGAECPRMKKN